MIPIEIYLNEKNLIYLLNCINYVLQNYKDDNIFFKKTNFNQYYNDLILLHRILSLAGNKSFYNVKDDVFFIGQKYYLSTNEKDFEFLHNDEYIKEYKSKQINKNINNNETKYNYFKSKYYNFKKYLDKLKKVV